MSDAKDAFGFGKYVPGFEFLQGLAKNGASGLPQMPSLSNWVAPTINVEELDKRIEELKAVQFWLDQNATALKATIQALEVQKMTLSTLKGMNFNMGDVANAFKLKAAELFPGAAAAAAPVSEFADMAGNAVEEALHGKPGSMAGAFAPAPSPAASPASKARPKAKPKAKAKPGARAAAQPAAPAGVVDPMQWWGALTQQFQQIATTAMKDAAQKAAIDTTRNVATGLAKGAVKGAVKGAMKAAGTAAGVAAGAAGAAAGAARKASTAARSAPAKKKTRTSR